VLDPHFEGTLSHFMKNNWEIFDHSHDKKAENQVFTAYRTQMQQYLE
jgi:hypothetical protein